MSLQKRFATEFIGTFILMLSTIGAFTVYSATGGNLGIVGVGLISGFALLGLIYAIGDGSGAHFNPAITLAFAAFRKFPINLVVPYVVAQLLGSIAAVGVIIAVTKDTLQEIDKIIMLQMGLKPVQAFGVEVTATFILMLVIMGVAMNRHARGKSEVAIPVGLIFAMVIMLGSPLSGGAFNPARAFGPAVWTNDWSFQWIYWVAPIVGAMLAAIVYEFIKVTESPKGHDFGVLGPIESHKR